MKKMGMFSMYAVVLAVMLGLMGMDPAYAQTTGKLTGRVTDTAGHPLPGVNVVVQGTRRGAVSDADGYYLILSMDPGTYTLVASMVGYQTVSKEDAVIQSTYTTTVNFQLKETTLQAAELVVTATRPPVEPDKTTSRYVMGAQQIQALPAAHDISQLAALSPGVNLTNTTVIRGGDSQDAAFYVDGIRLPNNDGYGRQFTGINKSAVQEITVISGGASAEYGNLESGAISVVTKDGGQNFRGWGDYRFTPSGKKHWGENIYYNPYQLGHLQWSNPQWRAETVVLGPGPDGVVGTADDQIGLAHNAVDYTGVTGSYLEGGLSGPLGDQASFFGTARWTKQPQDVTSTTSALAVTDPSQSTASLTSVRSGGFPTLTTPLDIRGNLKLTFRPSSNVKLSVGEIYSRAEGYNIGTNTQRDLLSNGQNIFLPSGSGAGKFILTDNILYASLTHTLSPKTFYELKLSYYTTTQDTADINQPLDQFGFPESTFGTKDLDGWYNVTPAGVVNYTIADHKRLNLKFDMSSQVTRGHFIKFGFDLWRYSLYYYNYSSPNPSSRAVDFITEPGHLPNDKAPVHPIQMSFYVQDKMEFEGMVLNAGIRWDALYTNTHFYNVALLQAPPYQWLIEHVNMPKINPTWAHQLSPRFGISHPITSRSAFHFTAGLYANFPDFLDYFRERWVANGPDVHQAWDAFSGKHGQNQMANPYVALQRTRAYEVGADWNFVSDYVAGLSAYYNSAIAQVGSGSRYWFDPRGYTYVWGLKPRTYEDMKGFEAHFRKGFSHYFQFNASINFGWATSAFVGSNATMFFPDSSFVMNDQQFHTWQWNGSEYVPEYYTQAEKLKLASTAAQYYRNYENNMLNNYEQVTFEFMNIQKAYNAPADMVGIWQPTYGGGSLFNPKSTDQRTQASLSIFFNSPKDFGPKLRHFRLLGDLQANLIWHIQSGSPVWYAPPGQNQELRHKPIRTWTDLEVQKTLVSSGHRDLVAYVEVYNLFNQKDSDVPYNYPDYVRWGLNLPRPNDANYLTYGDYNDLFRYEGKPRDIGLGVKLNF